VNSAADLPADKEIPSIACPADITIDTLPGQAVGTTAWDYPVTGDNSGLPVSIEGTHDPADNSFTIGCVCVCVCICV
jgi:hypothetical protein